MIFAAEKNCVNVLPEAKVFIEKSAIAGIGVYMVDGKMVDIPFFEDAKQCIKALLYHMPLFLTISTQICCVWLVDISGYLCYYDVKNRSKGGTFMRKTYIDNIRWITVVLVVIYHVIYMFNSISLFGVIGPISEFHYQDVYQYIVYPWFMLLLFVVSGMSARFSLERHSAKEFRKSRTTKLLVPSTIGLFVFWWILGYYNTVIGGGFESIAATPAPIRFIILSVSGSGPLWYIQLLWLFSMILLLIRKIEKDKLYRFCERVTVPVLMSLVFVIWGAAQILNTPIIVVYRFGIYGVGFLFGYFIFSHDQVMEKLEKWWWPLLLAAVTIGIVFVMEFWGAPYAEHTVLDTFLCNLYAWTAVLAILASMKKWGNFDNAFSRWMTRKSWGLYLFHYLPLAACAWYLHKYTTLPALAIYLCVGAAAFIGAYALYEIISRIPVLRWCVCGIGRDK